MAQPRSQSLMSSFRQAADVAFRAKWDCTSARRSCSLCKERLLTMARVRSCKNDGTRTCRNPEGTGST
jgi:hypothetical protein